jgi:cytoplasmic iron level regulating protein YaaA (DUF328/UPF0246 family)
MHTEPGHKHLLILACSNRKRPDPALLPAIDRYTGVNYIVIQKARRDGYLPANLDILILSAKYGILHSNDLVPPYNLKMTSRQAKALQVEASNALDLHLSNNYYSALFINLGRTYFTALACSQQLPHLYSSTTFAYGGIGQRMAQMKRWLMDLQHQQ